MTITGLKRVLGLPEATFICIGYTIGAGVFVFTGIVAKITGPALPLAYGLAVIPVFISMLPIAMLGSVIPTVGGNYRYPSRMVSPGLAFVGIWVFALAAFFGQIPLYAISCANYARAFLPLPVEISAILLLTAFFLINLLGISLAAQIQGVMVLILILALLLYSGKGLFVLDMTHFQGFMQQGTGNLILGVALLTFTYLGANGIIELGGEIRHPGKVIPAALFISFPIITLIYLLVALATVGAVPPATIDQKQPLLEVSRHILGAKGTLFFTFGGAILALTTSLNALFIVGTKSILTIIDDRLLPSFLGKLHPRFGTPYIILTFVWIFSVMGVLTGFSLGTLASYSALGGMMILFPVMIASIFLPRKYPKQYKKSEFRLKGFWLWFCPSVGCLMVLFFSVVILSDLKSLLKILFFLAFILSGICVYQLRKRNLMKNGVDIKELTRDLYWLELEQEDEES